MKNEKDSVRKETEMRTKNAPHTNTTQIPLLVSIHDGHCYNLDDYLRLQTHLVVSTSIVVSVFPPLSASLIVMSSKSILFSHTSKI